MGKGIERVFIGWDRPLLHSVADVVCAEARAARGLLGAEDFSRLTIVLPGARAGRRLLEILTQRSSRGVIVPPRLLTLGTWASLGVAADGATPSVLCQLAAWLSAMERLPQDRRQSLSAVASSAPLMDRLGIARLVARCHDELCGEGLRFAEVPARGQWADFFCDGSRWAALAELQALYQDALRREGIADRGFAILDRLESGSIDERALSGGGRVLLAGISEMNRLARRCVDVISERCVALVGAPADLAHRFDEHGCVIASEWAGARIDLPRECVRVAESPEGQAAAALRTIESITRRAGVRTHADQVTIGVPDAEVEERIRRLAGRRPGVVVRRAEGAPVAFTRPVKLLLCVAEFIERRDFGAFAALVRHPDAERWLQVRVASQEQGVSPETWLRQLDEYQETHLRSRIDGEWRQEGEEHDGRSSAPMLRLLHGAVMELLGPRPGHGSLLDGGSRPPSHWSTRIWDVIREVYGGVPTPVSNGTDSTRTVRPPARPRLEPATREACSILESKLSELGSLPPGLDEPMCMTAAEAVRICVGEADTGSIPESGSAAAIDLVGWLELPADDAPWMIVTGMNDGVVPAAGGTDPLLPESLRRALGLRDRRARSARDAFALLQIVRSRAPGDAVLLFGRRRANGDPMTPSRLLLAGDELSLLDRVGQWASDSEAAELHDPLLEVAATSGFRPGPVVLTPVRPIEQMSVTSFRQYMESPYAFYLRHVLRLDEQSDRAFELDAMGFGSLVHDVLRHLVEPAMTSCSSAEELEAFLLSHLDGMAGLRFGAEPRAEVRVQLEQARARLRAFARVQADWAKEGWRVLRTELDLTSSGAHLMVDGIPMYLRGRIDRVDINTSTGAWVVLDYKTGDKPPTPTQALSAKGEWRDPQLPLYRHLIRPVLAELGVSGEPRLGWIAVPPAVSKTAFVMADWSADDLAAADAAAARIIRAVRAGEFASFGSRPPWDGIVGMLCGGLESQEVEEAEGVEE